LFLYVVLAFLSLKRKNEEQKEEHPRKPQKPSGTKEERTRTAKTPRGK
jgi:hypothetical protein